MRAIYISNHSRFGFVKTTVKDQKYFHKIKVSIDFSVFSCSLEDILWHYCSRHCNNFGTGRKLDELCKQCICFISVVHLIPEKYVFKLNVQVFSQHRH